MTREFPTVLVEERYGNGWIAISCAWANATDDQSRIDWLLASALFNEHEGLAEIEHPEWLAYGETPEAALAALDAKVGGKT